MIEEGTGYLVTKLDKLSEFAFVYESDCNTHWLLLIESILFITFIFFSNMIFRKKYFYENKKHHFLPIIGFDVYTVILIVTLFFAHCKICIPVAILAGLVWLAGCLFFVIRRKKKEAPKPQAPAKKPETTEVKEVKIFTPVTFEAPAQEISLHDAMEKASSIAIDNIRINKVSIADFLQQTFGENVIINRRDNYIRSGVLPMADTHYAVKNGKKICFAYVYELHDEEVFFILKCDDKTAREIATEHPTFTKSAFPKSSTSQWYTMFVDDTFTSPSEVLDVIAKVYANVSDTERISVRSKVNVKTAQALYGDREIEEIVREESEEDVRYGECGKEAIINVDTLFDNFEDGAEVNIQTLKQARLVPANAKRIKVLARGELPKKLTVVADSYFSDAAKMIVAVGGKLIHLKKQ